MKAVKISVCTRTVFININNAIANLLVQPGDLDLAEDGQEVWSGFDIWWHALMVSTGEDFNTT